MCVYGTPSCGSVCHGIYNHQSVFGVVHGSAQCAVGNARALIASLCGFPCLPDCLLPAGCFVSGWAGGVAFWGWGTSASLWLRQPVSEPAWLAPVLWDLRYILAGYCVPSDPWFGFVDLVPESSLVSGLAPFLLALLLALGRLGNVALVAVVGMFPVTCTLYLHAVPGLLLSVVLSTCGGS